VKKFWAFNTRKIFSYSAMNDGENNLRLLNNSRLFSWKSCNLIHQFLSSGPHLKIRITKFCEEPQVSEINLEKLCKFLF